MRYIAHYFEGDSNYSAVYMCIQHCYHLTGLVRGSWRAIKCGPMTNRTHTHSYLFPLSENNIHICPFNSVEPLTLLNKTQLN